MTELPRTQALRCFITVAREGTVSRAAAMLKLTQPAVSLQLKALEESTGLQLFNRTPSGFTLTGFLAWVGWLLVHLVSLVGFRNRAAVFGNWFYNYLTYDRGPRLILGAPRRPARVASPAAPDA